MRNLITIGFLLIHGMISAKAIDVGKSFPVKTLRQAISMAQAGDSIILHAGIYREGNITIDKPIFITGVGRPVLDGEHKNEILTITGRNITVRSINFINAGYSSTSDFAAIKIIDASQVLVEDNIVDSAFFAVHVSNSLNSAIRNNIIRGTNKSEHLSGNGIHLWKCSEMKIQSNRISGHRDGIYFEFVSESLISNNLSENNVRYGLHFMFSPANTYFKNTFRKNGAGVAVMYSKHVKMENNEFDENWGASSYGILLKDITDSEIRNNRFLRNTVGIYMEGSSRLEVSKNVFRANGWALKVQASCDDIDFHHNNFSGNSFDVATNGTMTLNKFSHNYWDKYEGYDMNRDGIGDVPYHPVSMYAMVVEQNPNMLILSRSFIVSLLDKAEKIIPSLTPENLVDTAPAMKPNNL